MSIELFEEKRSVCYTVDVNENEIDMELLRQYAKSNMLTAVKTGDIQSSELQFFLYCMNNSVNLEYIYQSRTNPNDRFVMALTSEELNNAFRSRSDYKAKEKLQ